MATDEPATKKRRITLTVGSEEDGNLRQIELSKDVGLATTYLQYLSTGEVPQPNGDGEGTSFETYIKLYQFGEQAGDDGFCNAIIEALCKKIDGEYGDSDMPSGDIVVLVYSTFSAASPLPSLIAAAYAQFGRPETFQRRFATTMPAEFAWDVLREIAECREQGWEGLLERKKQWFKWA